MDWKCLCFAESVNWKKIYEQLVSHCHVDETPRMSNPRRSSICSQQCKVFQSRVIPFIFALPLWLLNNHLKTFLGFTVASKVIQSRKTEAWKYRMLLPSPLCIFCDYQPISTDYKTSITAFPRLKRQQHFFLCLKGKFEVFIYDNFWSAFSTKRSVEFFSCSKIEGGK